MMQKETGNWESIPCYLSEYTSPMFQNCISATKAVLGSFLSILGFLLFHLLFSDIKHIVRYVMMQEN